ALHLRVLVQDIHERRLALPVVPAVAAVHRGVAEQRLLVAPGHGPVARHEAVVVEAIDAFGAADEARLGAEQPHGGGPRARADPLPDALTEAVAAGDDRDGVVKHASTVTGTACRSKGEARSAIDVLERMAEDPEPHRERP